MGRIGIEDAKDHSILTDQEEKRKGKVKITAKTEPKRPTRVVILTHS